MPSSLSQLTPYLVDQSLVDFTVQTVRKALLSPGDTGASKKARLALGFFTNILDESLPEENVRLVEFRSYAAALDDPSLASEVIASLPIPGDGITADTKTPLPRVIAQPTAAQRVLELPDTLNLIMAQVPVLPKSRRDILHAASLTSRSFHYASQLSLWSQPRDLNTVEQQVQFLFGVTISAGLGEESLGNYVQRLRIRWVHGGWNSRLIAKITASCPYVRDLTLHWGDSEEGPDPITPTTITTLYSMLSPLKSLTHLYLCKFSSTPEVNLAEVVYPDDAHLPFTTLESFRVYDFAWYWQPIAKGLGTRLRSLDIGFGTDLTAIQLTALPAQLPSLDTIRLAVPSLEAANIRDFISHAPGIQRIEITEFSERDETYASRIFQEISAAQQLVEVSTNIPIGLTEIEILTKSSWPLEVVDIKVAESVSAESESLLLELVTAKRATLREVRFSFEGDHLFVPSDAFVTALAGAPRLTHIGIDFDSAAVPALSSSAIDALLEGCANLFLTGSLETLVAGNALYEKEYKQKLEQASEAFEQGLEDDKLGS